MRFTQALDEIDPLEAVLVKESDGSDWELGAGSLGKVRIFRTAPSWALRASVIHVSCGQLCILCSSCSSSAAQSAHPGNCRRLDGMHEGR